jgi:Arc/MetJ-type ribon-helix-helix transcriptional regulator
MVRERPDGRFELTAIMPEQLANQVKETVENDPEMNDSRLVREALRRELQRREFE